MQSEGANKPLHCMTVLFMRQTGEIYIYKENTGCIWFQHISDTNLKVMTGKFEEVTREGNLELRGALVGVLWFVL